ncbi:hypothetical protein BGZ51_004752 [Haplosporangium sp. Z 767]|nr:hypothetical protein BGZ51_004752 [Haplosporangium sp. Z 767]
MHKSLVLMALLATSALAQGNYHMDIYNNQDKRQRFYDYKGHRSCFCLKNTQTAKIKNVDVGDAKLFSTTDCTGNFVKLGKGNTQLNAQWVNSFSFGDSGIPSEIADPRLSGIELGKFLIKRVVRSLKSEFPQIKTFSTLSPIPGSRKWIVQCQNLRQKLLPWEESIIGQLNQSMQGDDVEVQFSELLKRSPMVSDNEIMGKLWPILLKLCAKNGACAHRLNWLGDTSSKGMEESFGSMINYLHSLNHIEMNNQQYLQNGTISVSSRDSGLKSVLMDSQEEKGSDDDAGADAAARAPEGQFVMAVTWIFVDVSLHSSLNR